MCDTCGCNVTPGNKHLVEANGKLSRVGNGKTAVDVLQGLLSENDHQAMHNRQHFDKHQVLAINLMSSPGAGKTALLEATIDALQDKYKIAVIEGDLETENDAERIRARGVTAIQIATGTACHLDAHMVHDALHNLDLPPIDIVFIENVGNLVCPASFDLGHHRNVTLLSVPEGDDKPAKYPVMFRAADLMLLTKTDLLEVLDDFKPENAEQYLRHLSSEAPVMQVSSKSGEGMQEWLDWLQQELETHKARVQNGEIVRPAIQADGLRFHATTNPHDHHHGHDHSHG
ncbi:MAG: hydrogenase nickel incorporation protein HypB [Gammaproteobacteria bacterium]|nr:hydrogenase nickel incorporation protein HypB [Gammaproteobacteria bacterium]